MKIKHSARWLSQTLVLATLIAGSLLTGSSGALADSSYGTESISYSGVNYPPTADKPQSKLWWNDGSWWADMWTSGSGWHIYRLDRSAQAWVDTGVLNDSRNSTLADTLWDGEHLYIASHVVAKSVSKSNQQAKLYRYSYANGTYTLDNGFPTTINNNSSETMTIDKDTTGAIWATWTQVGGNASAGFTNTVYVNNSLPGGTNWATPFVLPVSNPNPAADDISAVVAFGQNKIGVMWSDQLTGSMWWATRTDGTAPASASSWKVQPAIQGNKQADDHMNLKTLQADNSGRVYASVKTSLNEISGDPALPQLQLLVFKPGTGSFSVSTISTLGDCVSRPQIVLDTQNNLVHAFQTAPSTSVSGCAFSGVAGSIYEKTASMDDPVFVSGRGTPIIQDDESDNINNVTTTKQSVNSTTGLVVLASDDVTKRYWFADRSLDAVTPPPVAAFTATPTSGTAPLDVSFTDTSTGTPTSWSWTFGDGGTSTVQNPSHSYAAAGIFTATLTATNSSGSTSATSTITVSPAPPAAGVSVVGSTTATAGTASATVAMAAPAGTAAGDVLVAAITADFNPTMASVPAGWVPMVNALSINSGPSSGARAFAYYYVVGAADPLSYTWTLSTAVKWGAGITSYRGVSNTAPLDGPVVTAVDASYTATSITAPSITTATDGAMLIGGVACDCASPVVSAPSGWTERWETTAGQVAELADRPQATAGASGTATWTLSAARAVAAWRTALKPAS
ncbi:PKD domain-containing protein [Arthrobacter sp. CJ23]|uniref:PKD domain-containing protein n=1 Tax=Arthrobacter sp. CJ23 TaxID=2972479 RepID=UPI00215C184F|nr:PKD domain-containing protein [Arthrobacter sp. CJ23]UVJ39578.1 PKD domain-containing protein [Arthrobacter sp. CJ23]